MPKKLLCSAFLLLAVLLASSPALAQRSKGSRSTSGISEYLDDKGSFASRLWYGGNFNLGLSGDNFLTYFNAGISPMVGYKVFDSFSVGPRVSLQYSYFKGYGTDGSIHKVQPLSYSVGLFARYKIFRSIFAHAEYEHENLEYPRFANGLLWYDINQAKVLTQRIAFNNVYVGAGFNSSANGWGYELLLLYNTTQDPQTIGLPFVIRFGITYNF